MDDQKLRRNLQSVGMACYVAYHDEFTDFSIPDDRLISLLIETEGYTRLASFTRVVKSREIIHEGRDQDALEIIARGPRVAPGVAEEALRILSESDAKLPQRPRVMSPSHGAGSGSKPTDEPAYPFIRVASISELFALYAATLDELRERGIVRSANGPGGDYAELLCVQAFGWKRKANSFAGYDAIDTSNLKYQVKSRRIVGLKTSRQLSAIRKLSERSFNFLVGVLFNKDYSVMRAAIIPYDIVSGRTTFSKHTNSSIFFLDDSIWKLPDVRDVTAELRKAANELNDQI